MLTSPAGVWTGSSNPDLSLEIQDGGFLKITRSGKESIGEWKAAGEGKISATIDGQTSELPFNRKDLNLSITLPGDTASSDFTQM